jgi:hypothetical protein
MLATIRELFHSENIRNQLMNVNVPAGLTLVWELQWSDLTRLALITMRIVGPISTEKVMDKLKISGYKDIRTVVCNVHEDLRDLFYVVGSIILNYISIPISWRAYQRSSLWLIPR